MATATVTTSLTCTGLGATLKLTNSFTGTTPTALTQNYRVLGTADSEEALDLGDVATVEGVLIKAVSGAIYVDTSFDTTFVNELVIAEGESAYFKPVGVKPVYVINYTAGETPSYSFVVFGTT